jgi:hypothetical protein
VAGRAGNRDLRLDLERIVGYIREYSVSMVFGRTNSLSPCSITAEMEARIFPNSSRTEIFLVKVLGI